jgi:hypothetical protein
LATDEELAEHIAELPDSGGDRRATWSRAHRDYTAEVEMLTAVYDRIGELIHVTAAVAGGRGKPPAPAPGPVSAVEQARERLTRRKHKSLVSRVLKSKPAE